MTRTAAMPRYGENPKKSSSSEPIGQCCLNLVYSIGYSSTTKFAQMMTLGLPLTFLFPQLRSWWGILVCGCQSVHSRIVHARVLKFHVWNPHEKIFDTNFFLVRVVSLSGVMPPLKKIEWNLISYEPCMLGFWNFIYGFRRKIADPYLFSCPSCLPFWRYAPLKESEWNLCQQDISKSVWDRGLKFGQLIGDDE